jgi:hypothetical protein
MAILLMYRYRASLVRFYYNCSAVPRKQWSIDFGKGTPEFLIASLDASMVSGHSCLDGEADNKTSPRAWIEFSDVLVTMRREGGVLLENIEKAED